LIFCSNPSRYAQPGCGRLVLRRLAVQFVEDGEDLRGLGAGGVVEVHVDPVDDAVGAHDDHRGRPRQPACAEDPSGLHGQLAR